MTNNIPRCRSKTLPCPAGERCPQHRGLMRIVAHEMKDQQIGQYLEARDRLGDQETEEQKQARKEFFAKSIIKQRRNGDIEVRTGVESVASIVVQTDDDVVKSSHFLPRGGQKTIIPKPHPADQVDKRTRIYESDRREMRGGTTQSRFAAGVEEAYGEEVKFQESGRGDHLTFDGMQMPDDYRGRGIEAHVLTSWVMANRSDLYDFYGSEDGVPAEAYQAAGFTPNPLYWAGKTHPITGHTYPSREEMAKLGEWETNENADLYASIRFPRHESESYPWVWKKHGAPFHMLPQTVEGANALTREERMEIAKADGVRRDRFLKARGGFMAPSDLSLINQDDDK